MKLFRKKGSAANLIQNITNIDVDQVLADMNDALHDQVEDAKAVAAALFTPVDPTLVPKAGSNKAKVLVTYAAIGADDGASDAHIATLIGLTPQAVGTVRRAFIKDGLVAPHPMAGRFALTSLGLRSAWTLIDGVLGINEEATA